jgi:hypothetical protein
VAQLSSHSPHLNSKLKSFRSMVYPQLLNINLFAKKLSMKFFSLMTLKFCQRQHKGRSHTLEKAKAQGGCNFNMYTYVSAYLVQTVLKAILG